MAVKTDAIDLEVDEGTFASTVDAITSKVIGYGGFVADTTRASRPPTQVAASWCGFPPRRTRP